MKNMFRHRIQHMPVAVTGLSLGIAGLASVLDTIFQQFYSSNNLWWCSIPLIAISSFLLLLMTIRNFRHPKILKFDSRDTLSSSLLPTYSMTLMCIAEFIAGWQKGCSGTPPCQVIGAIVMCLSVLIQLIFIVLFFKNVLMKFKWHIHPAYGSWLVPTVGIITSCTFAGRFNENILPIWFFQAIWFFGFITFVPLFIVITYQLLFKTKAAQEKYPSIAVYFAPPNLVLAGFMQTFAIPSQNANIVPEIQAFGGSNSTFIFVMSVLLIMLAFTYTIVLWFFATRIFITHKFAFIFASFTFPLAIGSASMLYASNYLKKLYTNSNQSYLLIVSDTFRYIGYIFSTVAFICIVYIATRFFIKLLKDVFSNKNDDKHHVVYTKDQKNV
ncbi:C4-dicarboxylate transporter/malic acid transport protein [Malacoplasma iowae]|nr:hypothetical protein [Malacoplasma iowae]VEU62384.1 C4-dicarboxylate transporter/malic acid transport protein [Mycoplasmopsis fermentans]VEU72376.1 C4-dicarboxylate transporter/malic acid transport protein [Malacoplasma iowae]